MRISFFVLFFIATLAACTGPASKSVSYTPPETPGSRLCINQCNEARNYCREDCELNQRQCVSKVQSQALLDYEKYMSEQFMHSGAIELRARDFERLTPCDDAYKSCDSRCESQYQDCYQTCGGKVDITTSCQFLCF